MIDEVAGGGEVSALPDGRARTGGVLRVLLLLVAGGCLVATLVPRAPAPLHAGDPVVVFGTEAVARATAYQAPRRVLGVLALLLGVAVPVVLAATRPGRALVRHTTARIRSRPVLAALVTGLAVALVTDLVVLPLSAWSGLVHDAQYGFRTLSTPAWLARWALARLPGWVGVAGGAGLAVWLVRRLPQLWEPVLATLAAIAAIVLVLSGPLVIEPLTTRTVPLGPGPVRAAVTPVLDRAGLAGTVLVVADASRRTTKENAYVSGLGPTRRVVLYDTLLTGRTPPEVAAVVAHELGHDLHGDIERLAAAAAAGAILGVLLLGAILRWAGRRANRVPVAGALQGVPGPQEVVLALAALAVAGLIAAPVTLAVSRRSEAAADATAVALTGDPATVADLQRGLAVANLTDLDPPSWAVLVLGSHPTPPDRIATAMAAARGER